MISHLVRREHLAPRNQTSETLFILMRPIASASDASPATLRLSVRPMQDGVKVEVLKRKLPIRVEHICIDLHPSPILLILYGRSQQRALLPPEAPLQPSCERQTNR